LSDNEFDANMDKVMALFKLMANIDKFEEHYRRSLSRRLLSDNSSNNDIEKNVVTRFKVLVTILNPHISNTTYFSPTAVPNSLVIWKKCSRIWSSLMI
jgi:Cullin family